MVGRSTTNQILLLFAEFLSVHHGKSPFQCLSESMSLALKKGVKSPSSIVSPWYPKAFPCSFIFFLPVCLVSLVVQIQIIIIHHSLHSNSINVKYQQMIIFSWILMKVYTISNSLVVQHCTISGYQHYWLVVWNHGILWLSIGKSINIISWCSRWFSRTKPSARLRGYSPLLAVEVCIQRRGRSKSWHAWGAAGVGLKTWSWPDRMRKRKSMNIRKQTI